MSSGRIAQHRNYGRVMAAHEREQKLRRIVRVVIYLLLILFLTMVFVMVNRWQNRPVPVDDEPVKTSMTVGSSRPSLITLIVRNLDPKPRIDRSESVIRRTRYLDNEPVGQRGVG